jgi:glycosyltransferase involved in cell wall biosynthesis
MFYTHNENFVGIEEFERIGPYSLEYDEVYRAMFNMQDVYVGTQTDANVKSMREHFIGDRSRGVRRLMMPFPDPEMFIPYEGDRDGILFIGRWEERKDPQRFVEVVSELDLPIKVLTNSTGQAKFVRALTDAGVKTFTVKSNLVGQEKVDYIRSAKVMYNPSKKESFGYTLYEAASSMPVVVEDYEWTRRIQHDYMGHNITCVGKNDTAGGVIQHLYQLGPRAACRELKNMNQDAGIDWLDFIKMPFIVKGRQTASGNITKKDSIYYHDHIRSLDRPSSVEDIEPVYRAGYLFNRIYTKKSTWLTKSNSPPSEENDVGVSVLFA